MAGRDRTVCWFNWLPGKPLSNEKKDFQRNNGKTVGKIKEKQGIERKNFRGFSWQWQEKGTRKKEGRNFLLRILTQRKEDFVAPLFVFGCQNRKVRLFIALGFSKEIGFFLSRCNSMFVFFVDFSSAFGRLQRHNSISDIKSRKIAPFPPSIPVAVVVSVVMVLHPPWSIKSGVGGKRVNRSRNESRGGSIPWYRCVVLDKQGLLLARRSCASLSTCV